MLTESGELINGTGLFIRSVDGVGHVLSCAHSGETTTVSGLNINLGALYCDATGHIGVNTELPVALFDINQETSTDNRLRMTYDATHVSELFCDASSVLNTGVLKTSLVNDTTNISSYQTWYNEASLPVQTSLGMSNARLQFGTSSNHKMTLMTNNVDHLRVTSGGYTHIGRDISSEQTTYDLQVSGTLACTDSIFVSKKSTLGGTGYNYLSTDLVQTENVVNVAQTTLTNTSAIGTDSVHRAGVFINGPVLDASSVITTTDASTLYLTSPTPSLNNTITNAWALYTQGNVRSGKLFSDYIVGATHGWIDVDASFRIVGGSVPTSGDGFGFRYDTQLNGGTGFISAHDHDGVGYHNLDLQDTALYISDTRLVGVMTASPGNVLDINQDSGTTKCLRMSYTVGSVFAEQYCDANGYMSIPNLVSTTQAFADNTKRVATTEYVQTEVMSRTDVSHYPTGFASRSDNTISYDSSTRVLTITPNTSFTVWVKGKRFIFSTPQVATAHADVYNVYHYYFDEEGVLHSSINYPVSYDIAQVCSVWYKDATKYMMCDMRYDTVMDRATIVYLHVNIGTSYVSGLGISGHVVQPAIPTDAGNTFAITAGVIADQSLQVNINAIPDGVSYRVFYMTGSNADWTWIDNVVPFAYAPAGYIQYNQWTGSTWQLTATVTGTYINYYVLFIPALTSVQMLLVPGQITYGSLQLALGETIYSLNLSSLKLAHFLPLYQITIYSYKHYTSTGMCRIEMVTRILGTRVSITQASSVSHNSLTGLSIAESGITYGHIDDQTQTIAGAKTFSSAPNVLIANDTTDKVNYQTWTNDLTTDITTALQMSNVGTAFGTTSTNFLSLMTNNVKRMVLTSDGFTAIGRTATAQTTYDLEVQGTFNVTGDARVGSTTESSSKDTGALIIEGGLGVEKNVYIGGNLNVVGTSNIATTMSNDVDDNVVITNSAVTSSGNDGGLMVKRYKDDIVADTAKYTSTVASATSTTITLAVGADTNDDYYNGWWLKITSGGAQDTVRKVTDYVGGTTLQLSLDSSISTLPITGDGISLYNKSYPVLAWKENTDRFALGFTSLESNVLNVLDYASLDVNGLAVSNTTDSTSVSTGALTVAGGAGIAKKLYVGTDVDFAGSLKVGGVTLIDSSRNATFATVTTSTEPFGTNSTKAATTAYVQNELTVRSNVSFSPTGVENTTDSLISYDPVTRVLTLSVKAPATSFNVWVKGVRYNFTTTQTTTAHPTTPGVVYFYYIDDTGTLTYVATTFPSYYNKAMISVVYYYDATHTIYAEERHGTVMDPATHIELHQNVGTYYISGLALSGYVLASGTPSDANNTFAIEAGVISDEQLNSSISAVADGGPYTVMYMTSANAYWTWTTVNNVPFSFTTGGYIHYNSFIGSTWGLTPILTKQYVNYYVLFTPSIPTATQVLMIPGQAKYSTLAAARSENFYNLNLSTLNLPEYLPLYQITYYANNTYSSSGKCRIETITRILGSRVAIQNNAATNHQALSGLQLAGTGSTYGHINDQAQTIDGAKTFSSALGVLIANDTVSNVSYQTWTNDLTTDITTALQMSNTGTAFGTTSTNALSVMTNNVNRMVLSSDGFTTIGRTATSQTTYDLEVQGTLNATGVAKMSDTTDSSSKDTGALVVEGGLGVEKNVYIGGNLAFTGTTFDQTMYTAITAGTVGASKALVVDSNKDIKVVRRLTTKYINIQGSTGTTDDFSNLGRLLCCIDDSMGNNTSRYITLGKKYTNKNSAEFAYYHTADDSDDNHASLGGYGFSEVLNIFANKTVSIGHTGRSTARVYLAAGVGDATIGGTGTVQILQSSGFSSLPAPQLVSNPSLRCSGNVWLDGSTMYISSDRRIKENIANVNISDAKRFVETILPKKYNLKTRKDRQEYGYIAQDLLRQRFGELVDIQEDETMKTEVDEYDLEGYRLTIDYQRVATLLHTYILDLRCELDSAHLRNDELEQRLTSLTYRLDKLEERCKKDV